MCYLSNKNTLFIYENMIAVWISASIAAERE